MTTRPPSLAAYPLRNPILVHALGCVDLGDSFARLGERGRALHYYGSAINDYLDAGLYDLAAELCGRVLDRFPDVVRARFTRAFLMLGKGLHDGEAGPGPSARAELTEYVRAARSASQQARAVEQLRRLAECTDRAAVVKVIAEQMTALGRPDDALRVLRQFHDRPEAPGDEPDLRARWARILRTA